MKKHKVNPEEITEGLLPFIRRTKNFPDRKQMEYEIIDFIGELKKTNPIPSR